jgi:hypothetical protein
MVARGHVRNGVVVLDGGVRLPEGEEVTVLLSAPVQAGQPPQLSKHSVLDIPPVSLGQPLKALASDDLLGEMLEGRP